MFCILLVTYDLVKIQKIHPFLICLGGPRWVYGGGSKGTSYQNLKDLRVHCVMSLVKLLRKVVLPVVICFGFPLHSSQNLTKFRQRSFSYFWSSPNNRPTTSRISGEDLFFLFNQYQDQNQPNFRRRTWFCLVFT